MRKPHDEERDSHWRGTPAEPVKRLSLNLPESLHTRFKTACSATNRKMTTELQALLRRRTEELEVEAGLAGEPLHARGASASLSEGALRRLNAVERALTHNYPTADIGDMLADIERGRDLR
ncbi:MAG: hypothetical protein OXS50_06995 [Gammaproteobacteria bacterium]|nr:hypothetical protein [Gammaproteobacteria bacterium]